MPAVSRFALVTRDRNAEFGTEIIIEGGKIKQVTEIGAPPGTMITVKQLFYNTPARRKFLKTISTEMGHIADGIAGIALGWPDVQFKLQHNGRTLKHWPSATDPFDRVVDVIGKDFKNELYRMKRDKDFPNDSKYVFVVDEPNLPPKSDRETELAQNIIKYYIPWNLCVHQRKACAGQGYPARAQRRIRATINERSVSGGGSLYPGSF